MKRGWIYGLVLVLMLAWTAGGVDGAPTGKVVVGMAGEPSTFDPHRITGTPISRALPNVFDTLLWRSRGGGIIPHLAKSYRLVTPTVWEFKLRKGIKFTNGEPLDAHAVKYSIERIKDPKLKSRQYGYFRSLDHVEVVDRYTVRVHTKYPDMFIISPFSQYGQIVPPKYYKSHDLKYLARHPVGSGPFTMVRWKKGQEIVYEANPNYWKPGVPRVKTAITKKIPEPTTRVAALAAGDVDLIDAIPPQLVPLVKSKPNLEVLAGPGVRTCYINMVIKPGAPWADVRVRRALNYAVDKDTIIKYILQGHARKIAINVGPTSYGFNPDLKPYPYDPALAKKLLAEAGYPNGFSLDMDIPLGRYLMGKQAAEAVAGQWAKVGVKVNVRAVEWGVWVKHLKARWLPRSKPFLSWACRSDTHLHSSGMHAGHIYGKSTWGGFRDKEVDRLLDDARAEPDPAKRLKKYHYVNRVIYEKAALVFLYQQNQIHGKHKRVDWKLGVVDHIYLMDIGLKPQN
ncbi:ABC transporter substrate-binding protein [Nitrospinota bacterium]